MDANKSAFKLFELSKDKLIEKSLNDIIPADSNKLAKNLLGELAQNGKYENELEIQTAKGNHKKVYLNATANFRQGLHLFIFKEISGNLKNSITFNKSEDIIIHSINEGIITTDIKGKIVYLNPAAEKLTGWQLSKAVGYQLDSVFKIVNDSKGISIKNVVKKVMRERTAVRYPDRTILTEKDGSENRISIGISPLVNKIGIVIGTILVFSNYSDESETLSALKESEEQLREAQIVANIGNYILDVKTGIWKSSKVLDKIFGINENYDKSVQGWISIIHPDWKDRMIKYLTYDVIAQKSPFNKEYKIIKKNDGATRWVHGIGRLEYDAAGNPTKMIGTIQDVTERKNAEEKLQESEQRYKSLFNNSRAVILLINPTDGRIIDANAAACDYYGWEYQKILTMKIYDISLLEPEKINGEIRYILANARKYFVSKHRLANGDLRDVEVYSGPLVLDNSTYIYSIIQDTTERNLAEQALQENQARLQSIFSVAPVGIGLNINRILSEVNDTLCQMVGYSKDELIGQSARILYPTREDYEYVGKEKYKQIAVNGKGTVETRFMRKDGKIIDVILSSSALDKNDLSKGVTFTAMDITERRQTEKELNLYRQHLEELVEKRTEQIKKQNTFLRTLIDTIPNPIFVKGKDGKFTDVNKAYENFMNLNREEIIGKDIKYFQPEETASLHTEADKKLIENYGSHVYETYHIKDDGTRIPVIVYKASFGITESEPEGITGLIVDVSKQKEMIEQTLESLERERELNMMKTNFISMASHEFRTPLTTILASADLIELHHQKWPIEKLLKHIKKIQDSVTFMTTLLDDVLTMSKSERGKLTFQPVQTHFKNLCSEIIEQVELNIEKKHGIVFSYKGNVESDKIDPKLVTHILTNLLTNAIKFTKKQSEILLRVELKEQYIKFDVSDNGIGIHKEDIDNLFEPFFRGRNSTDIKGTGLGLSIVKRCVDMHNGVITVESEFGRGTQFHVVLNI